jgi:hypothetical protein
MGYNTDFEGSIEITPALDHVELAAMHKLTHDRHENNRAYGGYGEAPNYYCDYTFSDDGTSLAWSGAEKSYDMDKWLELIVKKLPGHEFNGKLHARGEDFHDMWTLAATGRTVTRTNGWS